MEEPRGGRDPAAPSRGHRRGVGDGPHGFQRAPISSLESAHARAFSLFFSSPRPTHVHAFPWSPDRTARPCATWSNDGGGGGPGKEACAPAGLSTCRNGRDVVVGNKGSHRGGGGADPLPGCLRRPCCKTRGERRTRDARRGPEKPTRHAPGGGSSLGTEDRQGPPAISSLVVDVGRAAFGGRGYIGVDELPVVVLRRAAANRQPSACTTSAPWPPRQRCRLFGAQAPLPSVVLSRRPRTPLYSPSISISRDPIRRPT